MIISLHIENVAVIKTLDIEFENGFTVITGETGAGKSIIIDSVMLLLGAKAQSALVRTGERRAYVSAIFDFNGEKTEEKLKDLGISYENGELFVERTVNIDGKSTAKINGSSVTVANLRFIMSDLLSVNGQSESLSLKTTEAQLDLIDEFAEDEAELSAYREAFAEYSAVSSELGDVKKLSEEGALAADLLSYQIKEITAAKLNVGEEEELTLEKARLTAGEKTVKLAGFVYKAAYGNEKGASAAYLAERAASAMAQLSEYSKDASEDAEKLHSIAIELEDIARRTYDTFDLGGAEEEDPKEKLEYIEDRLDLIHRLKRKYGGSVDAVLLHRENAKKKLDAIENNEERISELTKKLASAEKKAKELAFLLNEKRRLASEEMTRRICDVLAGLDMPKVTFFVRFTPIELSFNGTETPEFYISANAGEDARPLALTASGGELSRVMLAIKSVGNSKSGEDTIIYDEIDTGVSGSTSGKIGLRLKESAEKRQIICITHSAQIAALADTHLLTAKKVVDERTESSVRILNGEERINEIARIIGGINVTETQKKAARELIAEGIKNA